MKKVGSLEDLHVYRRIIIKIYLEGTDCGDVEWIQNRGKWRGL
jgi:hypothetical protein